ncbi:MAG: protein-L-isoaspartate(D-aspartate) O-methyltransferase [Phycisphaerae bacterium]|nr:protein-L-isoaspartate(D-aspartate) O-methyltransferase [Phycisphaerae bacterium]
MDAADDLDRMVRTQLEARDIRDQRVLDAFRRVDRAAFVPPDQKIHAYEDRPLPIGAGQTISQPYMVAVMTQSLDLAGTERVLEIGTGSGYQTAILAHLAAQVYTIEVHATLLDRARRALEGLGHGKVHYRVGNGRAGWPEEAPFDRILCAAAAEEVPKAWIEQLADRGVLVTPVGGFGGQILVRLQKRSGQVERIEFCPCRFVPLVGGEEKD